MSNDASQTGGAAEAPQRDASLKVDPNALSNEEAEFARQMGFGDDGNEAAEQVPDPVATSEIAAPASETEPSDDAHESEATPEASGAGPTETAPEDVESDGSADRVAAPEPGGTTEDEAASPIHADEEAGRDESDADTTTSSSEAGSESVEWEEIHPRPASEGIQSTLEARADDLLQSEIPTGGDGSGEFRNGAATESNPDEGDGVPSDLIAAAERKRADLEKKLEARDLELERLRTAFSEELGSRDHDDKETDRLRSEVESLCLERDQLIDQLAVLSGELAQARSHAENLEASLRAARGALTPLPEGERALRAEVIGLRGRLEDLEEENQRLVGRISSFETELAIERAKVEDRQHEVCGLLEVKQELEARLAEDEETVQDTLARQREMLALTTRLQAENDEFRAAQLALQETLQARDLEIGAREEHLAVTKRGLASRDREILELEDRLQESERAREGLKTDLQRLTIDHEELTERLARREARIATLTQTLARVEEVIGHPIPASDPTPRPLSRAERTSPGSVDGEREKATPSATARTTAHSDTDSSDSGSDEESDDPDPAASCTSGVLPPILGLWRDRRFAEILARPEIDSTAAFFADWLIETSGDAPPDGLLVRSLGGRMIDAEVRLVRALARRGVKRIEMQVLEPDPIRANLRRQTVERAGLGESITVVESEDLGSWDEDPTCDAVLLSDALRGSPNATTLLDHLVPMVEQGAPILFLDQIASGPLQLSASAVMRLQEIWSALPNELAATDALSAAPERGDDGGFPSEENDPVTELGRRFHALVIAGFGHLADLVVGPRRGPALSIEDDAALALLDEIIAIDESRSRTEDLPPRHGLAVFGLDASTPTIVLGQSWPGIPSEANPD